MSHEYNKNERPEYPAKPFSKGYKAWNPGELDHSVPYCKVPTGYLPPDQDHKGVKHKDRE